MKLHKLKYASYRVSIKKLSSLKT